MDYGYRGMVSSAERGESFEQRYLRRFKVRSRDRATFALQPKKMKYEVDEINDDKRNGDCRELKAEHMTKPLWTLCSSAPAESIALLHHKLAYLNLCYGRNLDDAVKRGRSIPVL
jgi:hypothetical protein